MTPEQYWINYWQAIYFAFGVIATWIGICFAYLIGSLVKRYIEPQKDFCKECGQKKVQP